jgi:general stress protein YciG
MTTLLPARGGTPCDHVTRRVARSIGGFESSREALLDHVRQTTGVELDAGAVEAIAAMGGRSVPAEKRAFSQDPQFAAKAGRKGGTLAKAENRFFSRFPEKAVLAGQTSAELRRAKAEANAEAQTDTAPVKE